MKYAIFRVFLATTIFFMGYATPRISLAGTSDVNLIPPQIVLRGQIPAESPPSETVDSISLDWAVEATLNQHPSLAATWYEIKARQGAALQAELSPNPAFFGEIEEFGGSGEVSGTAVMSSRIGISQEFLLGGKIAKRKRKAEASTRIASLEYGAKIMEIRALVEKRFLEVFTLQERLHLQSEHLDFIQKTHDVVMKRVKAGDASPLDLSRSQIELASARIGIDQIRNELEVARHALAGLWGARSPVFSSVSAQYKLDQNFTEQELKEDLEQSPVWRLQEEQIVHAGAALDLAEAQRIPDIELEGGVQQFNESDDHAFFLGITIPLTLFDRNQGGIAEARAMKRKAHYEKESKFLALHMELQEAWQKLVSTRQAVQSLETEVLSIAQNAYESISKAYMSGEVDILRLLDAQRTWVEIRMVRLDLLHELESSRIEIKRLVDQRVIFPAASLTSNTHN
ncbi:MAG: TolC family protein [Proteobacteria bacterium]|nr:TolC family protein [Pseudomonadota bacterium]